MGKIRSGEHLMEMVEHFPAIKAIVFDCGGVLVHDMHWEVILSRATQGR